MPFPRLYSMKRAEKKHVLVDRYLDFYTTALAILKDDEDAKDAVQDALVNTLVKTGVKDPFGYCMQAVRNRCIDMIRHRGKFSQLNDNTITVDPEREALLRMVAEMKSRLPFLAKNIVELHYEEDYTIPEVASKLGISVSKVKRILAETKTELRIKLEI